MALVLGLTLLLALPLYAHDAPSLSAQAAVVTADGEIIMSKNADKRLPMASTTKIMTALVAIESGDITREVRIDRRACGVEGSSVYLTEGEVLTLEDLLYALMLESANDAAAAIACEVGGGIAEFAEMMNRTAEKLGLWDTHFMNPHGLDDPEHYTTASDLARLTDYALRNETFAKIVSTYKKTIPLHGDEGVRLLLNHNRLLKQYDDVIGVKTGFTKRSGRCLVSAARRDDFTVVAVTLNAPDDWKDHRAMQEYGFSLYTRRTLAKEGGITAEIACPTAENGIVTLTNREALVLCLPRDGEITYYVEAPHFVFPPVCEGEVLGRAVFCCDGREIGELPLYASVEVPEPEDERGFFEKILGEFR
ncbi:MAG: D-alanyl-D-alanine carboxypeptidase [Ruminococcaceae bacterium]|nr:D-alanyl-D-alanine carboxypeptidase [Oscillospiraceae bacterium]